MVGQRQPQQGSVQWSSDLHSLGDAGPSSNWRPGKMYDAAVGILYHSLWMFRPLLLFVPLGEEQGWEAASRPLVLASAISSRT